MNFVHEVAGTCTYAEFLLSSGLPHKRVCVSACVCVCVCVHVPLNVTAVYISTCVYMRAFYLLHTYIPINAHMNSDTLLTLLLVWSLCSVSRFYRPMEPTLE